MKTRTLFLVLTAFLLAGCWQKSVHPFYTDKDVIFDEKLVGSWKEHKDGDTSAEDDDRWTFTKASGNRYDLVIAGKEVTRHYDAHLFTLDGRRLLNLFAKDRAVSTIPAHHLFKIELGADLKLAPLNADWVQKWLRNNPASLAHVRVVDVDNRDDREKDELVLTADTKALQSFIRAHWNDEECFAGPTVFKPMSGGSPAAEKK